MLARGNIRFIGCSLHLFASACFASTPFAPVEIQLQIESDTLRYVVRAHADAEISSADWRPTLAGLPDWRGVFLAAGDSLAGAVAIRPGASRVYEVEAQFRTALGPMRLGALSRLRLERGVEPVPVRPMAATKPPAAIPSWVTARFVYEDRILDRQGYTGRVQILPLRHIDAEIVGASGDSVLARSRLDAAGRVRLGPVAPGTRVYLRLRSTTSRHPRYRVAVVVPGEGGSVVSAVPHALSTTAFDAQGEVDLGQVQLADADGYGALQAFHILDTVLDAFDAVATWLDEAPSRSDSLRLFWGPELRVRGSAYGNGLIEITSPGSGDTDGWSDAVVLHEVGHFVADRWLRDDNPGGLHLLGDVEQDLALAYSEGLASAFACWVRAWRGATRQNEAGEPMDGDFAAFVNAGLPPPAGAGGSLQYTWDVEAQSLNGMPLQKDGIGSETNLAGALWDLVDGSGSGGSGDDDATTEPLERVWSVLRGMRELPARAAVTFEDFWRTWQRSAGDASRAALREILQQGRIEFETDAAEPDLPPRLPPYLWTDRGREALGEVVLSEVVFTPRIAVEISNRSTEPRELSAWKLVARNNSSSSAPSLTYTLPHGFTLGPGARVVVHRGGRARDNSALDLYTELWTVPWFPGFDGALALVDASGRGVDFMRWDGPGTPSTIAPPGGTVWSGALGAATFGQALARRSERTDTDQASDFVAAEPSLGLPNDTPSVHRTFFPEDDLDRLRWDIQRQGVYTLQVRRLRNGATPRVEIWIPGCARAIATADFTGTSAGRLTLHVEAGQEIEARFRHVGDRTQFGVYDVALVEEVDTRVALPPTGLHVDVQGGGSQRQLQLGWWNAALYDSLRVRAGDSFQVLAGAARTWETHLPVGFHRVELEAFARGRSARGPSLLVAVQDWPHRLVDDFDDLDAWEANGAWATVDDPARGRILASNPGSPYPNEFEAEFRLRAAVWVQPTTELRFEHACLVRPEDVATLELSADWGASWHRLGRYDWRSNPGWRDGSLDAGDWESVRVPLGEFAGRPIQLRFHLETDFFGRAAGWFVDALAVEPAPPRPRLRLEQNVPNPFNPTTRIGFEIRQAEHIVLRIYDVGGREVRTLFAGWHAAGPGALDWDGRDAGGDPVASGVYLYELQAGRDRQSRKLVLLR